MDQEGNIISPLGCFKLVPRPVSTTSTVSSSSSCVSPTTHSTMVTTATPPSTTTKAVTTTTSCYSMVSNCTAFPNPAPAFCVPQTIAAAEAMTAASIPAPGFTLTAPRLTPCIRRGEVHIPPSEQIKKYESVLLDLRTAVADRDITIARIETELANVTHN